MSLGLDIMRMRNLMSGFFRFYLCSMNSCVLLFLEFIFVLWQTISCYSGDLGKNGALREGTESNRMGNMRSFDEEGRFWTSLVYRGCRRWWYQNMKCTSPDWIIYLDLEKRQSIIIIHTTVVEFMTDYYILGSLVDRNQEDIHCYCVRHAKSRSSIFLIAACVGLAFIKVKASCRRGGLRCYIIRGNIQIVLDCRYGDTIVYVLENLCTKTVINTSTSY